MSHALVTGGAGFIGSHMVDRLLGEGWQVTVVDNFDPFYDKAVKQRNIAGHLCHPAYRLVEADICDFSALQRELSGDFDVIVHLAAKAGVRPSIQHPQEYFLVNVQGTQNLLELARAWGTPQFVFSSSSSVYGVNPNVPWCEDDHVLMPISPYAGTKVSGELMGHVYSHLYDIRFIALRFFTAYGPRQRPDLAIHKFARRMLCGESIPVFGDGSTRRDYTYVADIVDGIRAAMHYDASVYEIFNIGNHHAIGLREMIAELEHALDVAAKLEWLPEQVGDVAQTWADIRKAQRLLGYHPSTSFPEGLAHFAAWLRGEQNAAILPQQACVPAPARR